MIVHFPNTAFVVLKGKDTHAFLDSVSTLDSKALTADKATWGACLTPQGKMMFAFIAFVRDDAVYLHTSINRLMDFGAWLSKYALNMDIEFSIGDSVSVYADTDVVGSAGDVSITDDVITVIDPRHANMGALLYVFDNKAIQTDTKLEAYHSHRIKSGVMDMETDFEQGKTFALETLLDKQNGVHFKKGCYIGQEVTARTHFKGKVKKHIVPIDITNVSVAVGDAITAVTDKLAGKILSISGNVAMAMLRTEYIERGCVETQSGIIKTIAPDWYFT